MIEIDHICLGSGNFWEASHKLTEETGLGNIEGGWFPDFRLANRIVPTGNDTYIEVEGVIDAHAIERGNPVAKFFHDSTRDGDCFIGWCARVDSREELEAVARRLGTEIFEGTMKKAPDGSMGYTARTPDTAQCWMAGLPNFFFTPDRSKHSGRLKPTNGTKVPTRIAWMELGGTKAEMDHWLGCDSDTLGLRFNGKAAGLYAMGIETETGMVEIHRPVLSGTTGKISQTA